MTARTIVIELALAALTMVAINAWLTRNAVHGIAPPLPSTSAGHQPAMGNGHPLLIDFWASGCPLCRLDQGAVEDVGRWATVVVVATQSSPAAIRHLAAHDRHLLVVADPHGAIAQRYRVRALPALFIVGPAGHIRFVVEGYTTTAGLLARLWLARLSL